MLLATFAPLFADFWYTVLQLIMKLAQSLALIISASFAIPFAFADFHIVERFLEYGVHLACPSDYYNCRCFVDDDRSEYVTVGDGVVINLPDNFFSVQSGLCGLKQLDFYKQSDGSWDIYEENGDGSLQGTCNSNSGSNKCGRYGIYEELVCYSYICNPT